MRRIYLIGFIYVISSNCCPVNQAPSLGVLQEPVCTKVSRSSNSQEETTTCARTTISKDNMDDFVEVKDSDLAGFDPENKTPESLESMHKIQKWLQATDYQSDGSELRKHLHSYTPGTGSWVRESDQYKDWHDTKQKSLLWIDGIPGSGKSVISASLTQEIQTQENVPVVFFFFRHIIEANRTPHSLIRDWLHQLAPIHPPLARALKAELDKDPGKKVESLSFQVLWNLFVDNIRGIRKLYCVVDALDEMESGNNAFYIKLVELAGLAPSQIKVMVTSRQSKVIADVFVNPRVTHVHIDRRDVDKDIALFVDEQLRDQPLLKFQPALLEGISRTICLRGDGLFLYARLMIDDVLSNLDITALENTNDIDQKLDQLPDGLSAMYNTLLNNHASRIGTSHGRELQLIVLQWVTHSARPLRIIELANIIMVHEKERGRELSQLEAKDMVRRVCGPLLEIFADETVQIIHHSFTEFLTDPERAQNGTESDFPVITNKESHKALALSCIKYLSLDCFSEPFAEERSRSARYGCVVDEMGREEIIRNRFQKHPFLEYASSYWPTHARRMFSYDEEVFTVLDAFLQIDSWTFTAWFKVYWFPRDFWYDYPGNFTPLHVAAYFGLEDYSKHLSSNGADTSQEDDVFRRTPISYASQKGYTGTVSILLEYKADAKVCDSDGLNSLHYAAMYGHAKIITLLIAAGVDPNSPQTVDNRWGMYVPDRNPKGNTPLYYAALNGHGDAVAELLKHVNANTADAQDGSTVLHWAVMKGESDVIETVILSGNVNINARDNKGQTALVLASAEGKSDAVRALLKHGANVKLTNAAKLNHERNFRRGMTALHHAVSRSPYIPNNDAADIEIITTLLIDHGINVDAKDKLGRTPLFYAAENWNRAHLVPLLLAKGADPHVKSSSNNSILHHAYSDRAVQILVNAGVNVNILDNHGQTALFATENNLMWRDIWKSLFEMGVDPNIKNHDGFTILQVAGLRKGYDGGEKLVMLLDAGANPNVLTPAGQTKLHLFGLSPDTIPRFVQSGCNVNLLDDEGRSPLSWQAEYGSTENFVMLINHGASISSVDKNGKSVFHFAVMNSPRREANPDRCPGALKVLFDQDPDAIVPVDYEGNTIFHEFCKSQWHDNGFATMLDFLRSRYTKSGSNENFQEMLLRKNKQKENVLHLLVKNVREAWGTSHKQFSSLLEYASAAVNEKDEKGRTPLHYAAAISEYAVSLLLDKGADVTIPDKNKRTPLHFAARAHKSNIVSLLLDKAKPDLVNRQDNTRRAALFDAVRSGHIETVRALLKFDEIEYNLTDTKGRTLLHAAAEYKEEKAIWKVLEQQSLQKNALRSLVIQDDSRYIPEPQPYYKDPESGFAGSNGYDSIQEIVLELLQLGCDPSIQDNEGDKPIDLAATLENDEVVEILFASEGSALTDKKSSAKDQFKAFKIMKSLMRSKVPGQAFKRLLVNSDDDLPKDLGALAVLHGNREIVDAMMAGLNENSSREEHGSIMLHAAAKTGWIYVVDKLKSFIHILSKDGSTALHLTTEREESNLETMKMLIKAGIDVNVQNLVKSTRGTSLLDLGGETALHSLVRSSKYYWQIQATNILLKAGADVDIISGVKKTPLALAIRSEGFWQSQIVDILLDHGAAVTSEILGDAINTSRDLAVFVRLAQQIPVADIDPSLLFQAVQTNNLKILQYLVESGVSCHVKNTKGKNLLQVALLDRKRPTELVDFLVAQGVDAHNADNNGETAVISYTRTMATGDHTLLSKHIHLFDLEIQDKKGNTALVLASKSGHYDVMSMLIKGGADPTALTHDGKTTLINFLQNGYRAAITPVSEHVKLLFSGQQKPDVDRRDTEGNSAIHLVQDNISLLLYLVEQGANITILGKNDVTLLHTLASSMNWSRTRPGADKDDEANGYDQDSEPLKMYMSTIIQKRQISINTIDTEGETPLFKYFRHSPYNEDDLVWWKSVGADFKATNHEGQGLLHILGVRMHDRWPYHSGGVRAGELDSAWKFLVNEEGLNPNMEDKNGKTPEDIKVNTKSLYKHDDDDLAEN